MAGWPGIELWHGVLPYAMPEARAARWAQKAMDRERGGHLTYIFWRPCNTEEWRALPIID